MASSPRATSGGPEVEDADSVADAHLRCTPAALSDRTSWRAVVASKPSGSMKSESFGMLHLEAQHPVMR